LDLQAGRNPFAKKDTIPTVKNNKDKRQSGQKYDIPKKTLQLDVKRIAQQLGRLPTRDEVRLLSTYPYELFEKYFQVGEKYALLHALQVCQNFHQKK
jgi:site-specific DNA-methyltransferase (adenine-specific)